MKTKKCIKCGEEKFINQFDKTKNTNDGHIGKCKICVSKYNREYRKKHSKKIKEEKKIWYYNNLEQQKIKRKERYEKNKEKELAKNKEYKKNNPEKVSDMKKNYHKTRYKNDLIYKIKCDIGKRIRSDIKKGGYAKKSRTYEILGCSYEFFMEYIENKFLKGMSFCNHGKWEYDHIIPVSYGLTEDEIIKLNHYTNFQPLWRKDNRSKSNKIIEGIQFRIL